MLFEIRCKQSKHRDVFGISREIWNKHFAGRIFTFNTNDHACAVTIATGFSYFLPNLLAFKSDAFCLSDSDRQAMEYWLVYPQYKRRV